jgi:hypothetical protein
VAHVHRQQELGVIERELKRRGVSPEEVAAALAHGVDPLQSKMMDAVFDFVSNEEFEQAHNEVLQRTKLAERYAAHDRQQEAQRRRAGDTDEPVTPAAPAVDIEKTALSFSRFYFETARRLEMCSRAYLGRYMRAPAGAQFFERECVNGLKCICVTLSTPFPALGTNLGGFATHNVAENRSIGIGHALERETKNDPKQGPPRPYVASDPTDEPIDRQESIVGRHKQGFVCREFLMPSQEAHLLATGKLPEVHQVCLLCNRYATTHLYHQYTQQRGPGEPRVPLDVIHNHSVIVDQPGEYDHTACLATTFRDRYFTGIVKPFVGWAAGHYRFATSIAHGQVLPCVVETGALDFRLASDSATRT